MALPLRRRINEQQVRCSLQLVNQCWRTTQSWLAVGHQLYAVCGTGFSLAHSLTQESSGASAATLTKAIWVLCHVWSRLGGAGSSIPAPVCLGVNWKKYTVTMAAAKFDCAHLTVVWGVLPHQWADPQPHTHTHTHTHVISFKPSIVEWLHWWL